MSLLRRIVRALTRPFTRERDLEMEIESHLEMETAGHVAAGIPEAEARRLARLRFGGVERIKEECRDASRFRWLDDTRRDLAQGVRALRHAPAFTIAALLTLMLGVGGPAAILGAVRAVLIEPLPYPDIDRLVFLWQTDAEDAGVTAEVSPANFLDWRERSRSFTEMAALEPTGLDWMGPSGPVSLQAWSVYAGFFDAIGVAPALGRTFSRDEHTAGRDRVVVLNHAVWVKHFAGDPDIVGRTIQVEGAPWTVIGVMPEDFAVPDREAVWIPKAPQGWEARARGSQFYKVVARLRPDATLEGARAEMAAIAAQLEAEHPDVNAGAGIAVVPFRTQILGGVQTPLLVLTAAVLLVFLIACANLSNLQLARALYRGREFALRGALGAGPRRIVRQLVTENAVFAVAGCLLGFLFAAGALEAIRALAPPDLPKLDRLRADAWVLAIAAGAALLAAVLTGLAPAGAVLRRGLRGQLAEGDRATTVSRRVRRLSGTLVVAEIALSLILLIGAGLLLRSFVLLLDEDRGFRSHDVAALVVQAWSYVETAPERIAFARETIARLEALPGVRSAAVGSTVPMAAAIGAEHATFSIPGITDPGASPPAALAIIVSPGYFETLGIPVLRGRGFESTDATPDRLRAVISASLASRQFAADADPIGRTLLLEYGGRPLECEIIGVAGDVRRDALNTSPRPTVYLLFDQAPTGACAFFIRTNGDPRTILPPARDVIWSLFPTLPVDQALGLDDVVGASVRERRFVLMLTGLFAMLAFVMAVVGTFGVMSYTTATRTREIGVRMAFGATTGQVLTLVLGQAARFAILGVAIGLAGSMFVTRFLEGLLYGVGHADPLTYAAAALALLAAALLACWIPAARAARLDPAVALRTE